MRLSRNILLEIERQARQIVDEVLASELLSYEVTSWPYVAVYNSKGRKQNDLSMIFIYVKLIFIFLVGVSLSLQFLFL